LAACTEGGDRSDDAARVEEPSTSSTTEPDLPPYENPGDWLCHPDLDDTPCSAEVTVTAYDNLGGSAESQLDGNGDGEHEADCFYIHPTVGEDAGKNGDLEAGEGEQFVTRAQAAPLQATACRVFAPIFREATFHSLDPDDTDQRYLDVAYDDIRTAFAAYLARWNGGRPFFLVGHSQGAIHALRLLTEVIAADPTLQAQMLGAYVPGVALGVDASGALVDAPTFALCSTVGQRGCVTSFSAYDALVPPDADALFAHPWSDNAVRVACTNPAGYAATAAALEPLIERSRAAANDRRADRADTTFITYPGRFTARCVDTGSHQFLEVTNDADPSTPGGQAIPTGDEPKWGLHSIEMSLVLGNIIDSMRAQAAA
jgi:hypothetical protein